MNSNAFERPVLSRIAKLLSVGKWSFPIILPCKGRWMAVGQTEGYLPLDRATPLHHFVVPLPLQGRNVRALMVASRPSPLRPLRVRLSSG